MKLRNVFLAVAILVGIAGAQETHLTCTLTHVDGNKVSYHYEKPAMINEAESTAKFDAGNTDGSASRATFTDTNVSWSDDTSTQDLEKRSSYDLSRATGVLEVSSYSAGRHNSPVTTHSTWQCEVTKKKF
ncbi:MAG TPA: hypothetical protein VEG08_03115 [Terriglobales bacterium]|nr:hypothetical protein [Terriglobales bacterium]